MSVVRLVPSEMGSSFRLDADATLDAMKGKPIVSLFIVAELEDGGLEIGSNCNSGEALFLIERARHCIVFGE
jgi:hypothetical protein